VALLQLIYLLLLNYIPTGRRTRPQPVEPILPNVPQSQIRSDPVSTTQPGSTVTSKIVVLSGVANLSEIPLPGNDFRIGRFYNPEQGVVISLDEKSISRRHARMICDESIPEYYLTDTESTYGTSILINERFQALTPGIQQRIYNKDIVQFGNNVRVRFELPCGTRDAETQL
jgi:pSer/pThr/pTyr-binding forkhead associated (FHA) protein